MPTDKNTLLIKGALLLALTLVFQSLRFIIPLPPFVAMFLIGTLVNTALATATLAVSARVALFISIVAPLAAFLQGQLPLIIFVPVVMLGNCAYVLCVEATRNLSTLAAVPLCAAGKTATLAVGIWLCLQLFTIPPLVASAMAFALGWPQLVTASLGALLSFSLLPRLGANRNKY